MTKILLTLLSIFLLSSPTYSVNAPQPVQKAFEQKYPNAKSVTWDKENAHEYKATFKWNGSKYSANFNDTGEWLQTVNKLDFKQLPTLVKKSYHTTHTVGSAKAASKIETANGITKFVIEFWQGYRKAEVFYFADGTEVN